MFFRNLIERWLIMWQIVESLSTAVQAIVVIGAAWIALRQWRESLSARQIQGTLALIEQFQSSAVRGTRAFLERHRTEIIALLDGPKPLDKLDRFFKENHDVDGPRSLVDLRKNLAVLEFVAMLCLNDQLPSGVERSYLAPSLAHYWHVAEPVVRVIRSQRGSEIYLQHLGALVDLLSDGSLFAKTSLAKKRALRRIENQAKSKVLRDFERIRNEHLANSKPASDLVDHRDESP
jgi:hypothetical protein